MDLASLAREAFASGFALYEGPVTDRVRAGCVAAIEMACEHPDDPGVLEATLRLGELEGMWAQLYQRRDALYQSHIDGITTAWRQLVKRLDVPELVAEFRRRTGLAEAAPTTEDRKTREAVAIAAALAALHALMADTTDPAYLNLLDEIEQAIRVGTAEGKAGGLAIAAHYGGHGPIDFDRAYTDAYNAVTNLSAYAPQARAWAGKIAEGAATDIGRSMASDSWIDDADLIDTVNDTLDDARSAKAYGDWSLSQAFGIGALAVYAALNITLLRWITVGDERVCYRCEQLEAQSPYSILSSPDMPAHAFCRCSLIPDSPVLSLGALAAYLLN